jgi:hypothetical protein
MALFIEQFTSLGLAFNFDITSLPTDNIAGALNEALVQHFQASHLAFSPTMGSTSAIPISQSLPWTLLVTGKPQCVGHKGCLLKVPMRLDIHTMTYTNLEKECSKFVILPDQWKLLFICTS